MRLGRRGKQAPARPPADALAEVVATLAPDLKARGYRKQRHTFNRSAEPTATEVVSFQMGAFQPPGTAELAELLEQHGFPFLERFRDPRAVVDHRLACDEAVRDAIADARVGVLAASIGEGEAAVALFERAAEPGHPSHANTLELARAAGVELDG
jgi:hypothetical protein